MQKIYSYQVDFAYPMIVRLKGGNCGRVEINHKNLEKCKKFLNLE